VAQAAVFTPKLSGQHWLQAIGVIASHLYLPDRAWQKFATHPQFEQQDQGSLFAGLCCHNQMNKILKRRIRKRKFRMNVFF
jgi:hypothetical protein